MKVQAKKLTGEKGDGARGLDAGGLDGAGNGHPLRILPVVVLYLVVASRHPVLQGTEAARLAELGKTFRGRQNSEGNCLAEEGQEDWKEEGASA